MAEKTVLVTGIGGNVGQGILRNIRSIGYSIKLIGCDISAFTAGNHLCDKTFKVPYSYDNNYVKAINDIVNEYNVDLIIPSTDFEVYYLSLNQKSINAFVLASDSKISKNFLDKYLTYKLFLENGIPFAKSWLPEEYDNSEKEIIAKPREGRGSKGILINPVDTKDLGDNYMIQTLHRGIEITTSVYVNKNKEVHGVCSMERKLENGATSQIIINKTYDSTFLNIAKKIASFDGVRGSFNIQSIVQTDEKIFPFEINCRISGTNSIRHNLGFQDVKYGIQEYLYNERPDSVNIINESAIAVRILMDVIYPEAKCFEELNNKSSKHFIF